MTSYLKAKLFWGIRAYELVWLIVFYLVYGIIHYLALVSINLHQVEGIHYPIAIGTTLNFAKRLVMTIPIWWLIFYKYKHLPVGKLLLMHLVLAPIFIWLDSYLETNFVDPIVHRVKGNFWLWFDYYMPGLFYVIQFGIMHAYNFWLRMHRQTKKEKELLQLAYQSEVNALKAQIQPHFLFNTLNSISATVTPEQEGTRILIAKLADTFRYTLRATKEDFVPLQDELEFIRTYLEIEQERFKNRLQVYTQVDKEALSVLVPSMLLQPLVENAIRHGIGPSIRGGAVIIEVKKISEYVQITVSDTGIGFEGSLEQLFERDGVGLKNTALRLEKIYNEKIQIDRKLPSGLSFTFKIPLEHVSS